MPIPIDEKLYAQAKAEADSKYAKNSAYKSGWMVKRYKELGGRYVDDGEEKDLARWFKEKWTNIASPNQYPVLRPSKRINKNTPKTIQETDKKVLEKQIKLKQKIKGKKNLPKF